MVRLIIEKGEMVLKDMELPDEGNIFIIDGKRTFYMDLSCGKFFETSTANLEGLGEGHKKIIRGHK